jgi:hypothetical protein
VAAAERLRRRGPRGAARAEAAQWNGQAGAARVLVGRGVVRPEGSAQVGRCPVAQAGELAAGWGERGRWSKERLSIALDHRHCFATRESRG